MSLSELASAIESARSYTGKSQAELERNAGELMKLGVTQKSPRARAAALVLFAHAARLRGEFQIARHNVELAEEAFSEESLPIDRYHLLAASASIAVAELRRTDAVSNLAEMRDIAAAEGERELEARASVALAQELSAAGRTEEGLRMVLGAKAIYESLGDVRGIATAAAVIGLVRMEQLDFESALESQKEACKFFESIGDTKNVVAAELNIGKCLLDLKRPLDASTWLTRAMELSESNEFLPLALRSATLLGNARSMSGMEVEAKALYESVIADANRLREPHLGVEAAAMLAALDSRLTRNASIENTPTEAD